MPVAVEYLLYDIADEQEQESGIRQEGVYYGAHMFVSKASGGVGAAIGGVTLDLISWPVGEDVKTAVDIAPDTLFQLAMIAGPGLALGLLPALWCFNHITLNRQRHVDVLAVLAERKRRGPSHASSNSAT
jgi:GPH family glycoside/pentoside/hexuronide:cation symporter